MSDKDRMKSTQEITQEVRELGQWIPALRQQVAHVVVGQKYLVDRLLLGLLANGHRVNKLALCRELLDVARAPIECSNHDDNNPGISSHESPPCPCCGGRMRIVEIFHGTLSRPYHVRNLDGL